MSDFFTMRLDMSSEQMQKIFGMQDAYVKKLGTRPFCLTEEMKLRSRTWTTP